MNTVFASPYILWPDDTAVSAIWVLPFRRFWIRGSRIHDQLYPSSKTLMNSGSPCHGHPNSWLLWRDCPFWTSHSAPSPPQLGTRRSANSPAEHPAWTRLFCLCDSLRQRDKFPSRVPTFMQPSEKKAERQTMHEGWRGGGRSRHCWRGAKASVFWLPFACQDLHYRDTQQFW